MNFFEDDFGLGDSPSFQGTSKLTKKATNKSSKSVKNDDFDDLLEELIDKEDRKKSQKKTSQAPSLVNKKQASPPRENLTRTDRWDSLEKNTFKSEIPDQSTKQYQPLRNRNSKSIIDDKGSEDNKSYRSGFTGKGSQAGGLDSLNTMKFNEKSEINFPQSASMRSMMKPPLRKKQSRQPSIVNEQMGSISRFPDAGQSSFQEIESVNLFPPPIPRQIKEPHTFKKQDLVQDKKLEYSQSANLKQKVVYVKEDNKKVQEQFEKQVKMIKESHERQIKYLEESLKKQTETNKTLREKLMKENETQVQKVKRKCEEMFKKDLERVKEMHEWEQKKKKEAYQMEIERLKRLVDMNESIKKNITQLTTSTNNESLFEQKQKQLIEQRQRVHNLQYHLKEKERIIELRELDFQNYRKREEQKIQQEKKNNFHYQNELRKQQNEMKRQIVDNKLQIANDLANADLDMTRQKQSFRLELQEFETEKMLFHKMKEDYESFNKNILTEYKQKLKEVEMEKIQLQEREIELCKKLHTIQLMANAKGVNFQDESFQRSPKKNVENSRNHSNDMKKVRQTKERFQKMQSKYHENNVRSTDENLKTYLSKINKTGRDHKWLRNY